MSPPSIPALFVSHWELNWPLTIETSAVALLYLTGAARLGRRWPLTRTVAFLLGLGLVLCALESGLDGYDDVQLSVHMVQHMLLLLGAPLLMLLGQPIGLAFRVLRGSRRQALARALERMRPATRPWWCLATYYVIVLVTHLTGFYGQTLLHPLLHDAEHVLYLVAGALLWWPLLDGDPVLTQRLSGLGRFLYLLVGMIPMAAVGAYLDRYPHVVYAAYAAPAHTMAFSAVDDQATAGAIMWVVGNSIMWGFGLWAIMAALTAEERRQSAREAYAARTEVTSSRPDGGLQP